jgi:hypothetical protein
MVKTYHDQQKQSAHTSPSIYMDRSLVWYVSDSINSIKQLINRQVYPLKFNHCSIAWCNYKIYYVKFYPIDLECGATGNIRHMSTIIKL